VARWCAIREGRLASITDIVERILGRKPITLEQWLAENAATFQCSSRYAPITHLARTLPKSQGTRKLDRGATDSDDRNRWWVRSEPESKF
jgi:hypothetical protein